MNGEQRRGLWLDISLWSADLANLESEIRRLEPAADSFHLDAADGHYTPNLLFFPDLVARLRALTRVELHLHLMATRPMDLLGAFLDAGVGRVTVPMELGKRVWQVVEFLQGRGKKTGVSLELETPVELARPFAGKVDLIVMMGTPLGVKGCGMDERAPARIRAMKALMKDKGTRVWADGGIREETVPLLRAAGADGIVPGSVVCGSADVVKTAEWLRSLE